MAYVKIVYQNSPSTATPLNAENLNHMDDQIALNDQRLTEIETSYVKSFNGRKGEVTPQANDYNMSQITPTNGATVGQIPIVRNDGTAEEPNLTFHMEDVPSSGHVIKDQSGTSLAQEDALQFADAFLTDDSVNSRTVVENIKEVDPADYASTTDEGIIVTDDGNDALIGAVSDDYVEVTADGEKTIGTLLNELASQADFTKLLDNAYIQEDISGVKNVYLCRQHRNNSATFFNGGSASSGARITTYYVKVSSSLAEVSTGTSYSDVTASQKPSLNTVIRLYYGNKKATVDLQTTSNRCVRPNGETVEQALPKEASTTFVPVNSSSPVTIPDIRNYRYITVGYVISNQSRFFSLATLPTSLFANVNRAINILYGENESEVTLKNYTSVNVRINQTLGWPIMIILS